MMNVKIQWLLCILVCALGMGCRSRMDPSVDLLESELRWMEDQLYLLDDELERKCQQLASSQRENATLRQELSQTTSTSPSPSDRTTPAPAAPGPSVAKPQSLTNPGQRREGQRRPPSRSNPSATPPSEPQPPEAHPEDSAPSHDVIPEVDELHPPNVELGTPAESVPEKAARVLRGATLRGGTSLISTGNDDEAVDAEIVTIELNSRLTGGYDFDGQPGHEGLLAVIEPRNVAGQYVPLPGNLSLVVIDPALSGPAARVARWDYSAAETVAMLRKSLLGQGIHLQLPWPHEPPMHDRLEVFARYTTADGRKLQAQRSIQVAPLAALPRQSVIVTPMDPAMAIPPASLGPTVSETSGPPVSSDSPLRSDAAPKTEIRSSSLPRLVRPTSSDWQPYR